MIVKVPIRFNTLDMGVMLIALSMAIDLFKQDLEPKDQELLEHFIELSDRLKSILTYVPEGLK